MKVYSVDPGKVLPFKNYAGEVTWQYTMIYNRKVRRSEEQYSLPCFDGPGAAKQAMRERRHHGLGA